MKFDSHKLKNLTWVVVICFIAFYLAKNSQQLFSYGYDFEWAFLPISLCFIVFAYLLNIAIWIGIASHYGAEAHWLSHARVWSTSRLGRYVPGKVASVYLRIDGYDPVNRGKAGVSLYIETAASLTAVCTFILVFSVFGFVTLNRLHLALLVFALACLLLLSSGTFLRRVFGRFKALDGLSPPKARADGVLFAKVVGSQICVMTLHGVSLLFAISAFANIDASSIIEVTVFYYFAGLVGMLALFAPAGIGVREAVLVSLLQTIIPLPIAVASVALIRLLTIIAELALSATLIAFSPRETISPKPK